MKYIITESKLEKVIIKYLNKFYGDLEEYRTDEYPDSVFFIKGKKVYMELNLKNNRLYISSSAIWDEIQNFFGLKPYPVSLILKKWVKDTYGLGYIIPLHWEPYLEKKWSDVLN
jgi:hypothetical protein